jgi:uncharacterized membrane protein YdjX (TVP38/TMEM64 family)
VRRALSAGVAVAVLAAILIFGREAAARLPLLAAWVQSLGLWGPVVFILAYGIAAVLLIPSLLLTISAGAIWGFRSGLVFSMTGASLGASLAFFTARYLMRDRVARYVGRHPRLAAVDHAVASEGLRLMFLLRLSPVVPYNLLNYVLGVSRVRYRDYIAALAGMTPAAAMYVYAGKVAGDLASLASGASTRGPVYYALLGAGLIATIAAGVLTARGAQKALQQGDLRIPSQ